MNGRVYDPTIGRFMSVDPVFQFPENTQSLNPYSYVLNNPLSFTDPTGLGADDGKSDCREESSCKDWGSLAAHKSNLGADTGDGFGVANRTDGDIDRQVHGNTPNFTWKPKVGGAPNAASVTTETREKRRAESLTATGRAQSSSQADAAANDQRLLDAEVPRSLMPIPFLEALMTNGPSGDMASNALGFAKQIASEFRSLLSFTGNGTEPSDIAPEQMAGAALAGTLLMLGTVEIRGASIANPVPTTLARVVPGPGNFRMLGAPGATDVFVTAADDIAGMNATQISRALGIPRSSEFTVIRFRTPLEGIASPVLRYAEYPQFRGFGRTSGGAREFVIPNQPVPLDATFETIR